jgi:F-type H+-transporting ATPase subunit b
MEQGFFSNPETWVGLAAIIGVGILIWKAGPGLMSSLDARGAKIRAELDEAQRLREDAQKTLAEYQRKQRDALKEAQEIIAHARADAERAAQQAARDLEASLERRQRQALEKIALEEAKALAEVRNIAVDVAIAAARRVLAEDIDPTRRASLIDDAIAQLPQALH